MEANLKPQKMHFKGLTFISGVIVLVLSIALFAFCGYVGFVYFPELLNQGDQISSAIVGFFLLPVILAFLAIGLTLAVSYLVLGIMLITSSFKDDKVFRDRRGFVIFTIVADFIMTIILVLLAFAFADTLVLIFVILAVVIFLTAILKIVDLVLFKKREKRRLEEEAKKREAVEMAKFDDDDIVKPIEPVKNSQVNFDALREDK